MCSGSVISKKEFYQNFMLDKLLFLFCLEIVSKHSPFLPRGLQDQFLAESVCVVFYRILL